MHDRIRATWVRFVMALQFTIPGLLLADRLLNGAVRRYGWGWQMFSFG